MRKFITILAFGFILFTFFAFESGIDKNRSASPKNFIEKKSFDDNHRNNAYLASQKHILKNCGNYATIAFDVYPNSVVEKQNHIYEINANFHTTDSKEQYAMHTLVCQMQFLGGNDQDAKNWGYINSNIY